MTARNCNSGPSPFRGPLSYAYSAEPDKKPAPALVTIASPRFFAIAYIVRGESTQEKEKSGRIELLAPDMKTVLLSITLHGVGIVTLGSESETNVSKDSLPRLRAELYVEYVTVEVPK